MSGQIVPKRFGLKYSPKPAIALEYEKPDSGLAILEVVIEQLSPGTYDVEGVVDALQKNHPGHLGPNLVSTDQLERLVARLLFEGRDHLPQEYPTPTRMIVEAPQMQPSSFSSSSFSSSPSHERPTKPSRLPKGEKDFSGSQSSGPTPAPTPEVQRATRDPSIGSSGSSSRSSTDGSDDAGAEDERLSPATSTSTEQRVPGSNSGDGPLPPTATTAASNTAASPFLGHQDVRGWDDDEEENSRGGGDDGGDAREGEERGTEQARCGGGARESTTTEDSREEAKEPASLAGASSESDVRREQHETMVEKSESEEFHDHGRLGDEIGGYGQQRKKENKAEAQPASPRSFSTVEASGAAVDEGLGRIKSPRVSALGEDGTAGKAELGRGQEGGEERDEEEVPEIEDGDDDIPEDVESEELYETGSSHADAESKGDEQRPVDGGDNGTRSMGDGSSDEGGDTENDEAEPFISRGDAGTAVEKTEAFSGENHHGESERASPEGTSGEESGPNIPTPPPAASPLLQTSPTAAVGTIPPSWQGSSQEGCNPPPLSPLAPSRASPPAPSSPEAVGAGVVASPLAGLPLPPMGGGRQRLGLLGSLPPVGGRGLPSLAPPPGKKAMDMREGGERSGGVGREGEGGSEDDVKGTATGATGPLLVSGASPPLMSPRWSPTRSPVLEKKDPTASSHVQEAVIVRGDTADQDGGGGDVLDELARLSLTRGEGEEKKDEEDEEAALRAWLGFGDDEQGDDEEDEDEDEDEHERNDDKGSLGGKENSVPSPPGSPKQHQGQEEENAGRISPSNPRGGEEDERDSPPPTGGGAGGDYFGDTDEASSVGEDMSFEQESVDGGGGGGGGSGSDDYFS